MTANVGSKVLEEAEKLKAQGKDPNQIAAILCKSDNQGVNYGIGIVLNGDGQPMDTSSTLIRYAKEELDRSGEGTYLNSAKKMQDLKTAVLSWQRIPEKYWDNFEIALPSDAGTGAMITAVQAAAAMNPAATTLAFEEMGWPAYKAIANISRLKPEEFPSSEAIAREDTISVYQAGPMNSTGEVRSAQTNTDRAKAAEAEKSILVLDRAYSGFEFSRWVGDKSYDEIMKASFDLQIKPYIENGASFFLALSPTKAFVTFSLRPAGFLLAFSPNKNTLKKMNSTLITAIRARGSSFEHPVTRAFVRAITESRTDLENEHARALTRLRDSENLWEKLTKGTPMEYLFSNKYAGLFRNANINSDGPENIYNQHLYPVFANNRCRLNVTGIPDDESVAKNHVGVFSKYCH